jgi:hypothetical protein
MTFQQRIAAFARLGQFFKQSAGRDDDPVFYKAQIHNPWFTPENIAKAIDAWGDTLTETKLITWLGSYPDEAREPVKVAVIMAGNIPLVGFHDLLCVLISGNTAIVKPSSDDTVLIKWVIEELIRIEPAFEARIIISETRLPEGFDAVIATGSNNTNRYFEYYFRDKPSLLRGSRNSAAILSGNETPEDYLRLGEDIFTYFGLGCRNVSKLYVPEGFDPATFYEGIESFSEVINHHKYANNYTYHKAIFLMNLTPHLDNNFLLLKQDDRIASPLGVMFYEEYDNAESLGRMLEARKNEIQCIVGKSAAPGVLPLGKAQHPELWDYADGVDTLAFLQKIPAGV